MPSIHFRTTVDAPANDVYTALATQDGLAGNWTDQLEEMAMCAYTWAMIIERLGRQVTGGGRGPYFKAGVPLPR